MPLANNKKIYFASDQHFGAPTPELSFPREQQFVAWLDEVKQDAEAIFLLGDLFDFWFEYKTVVPKGFVRILGKLAEIRDSGIPIYFFVGNHDLWMGDYFQKELNIPVYRDNQEFTFGDKTFLIGHGDGKGPGDKGYKRMKKVFTTRSQMVFPLVASRFGSGSSPIPFGKKQIDFGCRRCGFFGRRKRVVDSICQTQIGNQTLQLPCFWSPSFTDGISFRQ
jgi:UDP-2,3-diacylglucosamine hydrolase